MVFPKASLTLVVIALGITAGGSFYYLIKRNATLRVELNDAQTTIVTLEAARERDSEAAQQLIEAMKLEQQRLARKLKSLSEVQDEEGRSYLNTPVPDSVRRLLNSK